MRKICEKRKGSLRKKPGSEEYFFSKEERNGSPEIVLFSKKGSEAEARLSEEERCDTIFLQDKKKNKKRFFLVLFGKIQ